MQPRNISSQNEFKRISETNLHFFLLKDIKDLDVDYLIDAIRQDSELSATIIEIANKNYYELTGEVTCIARAVRLIGITQLHYILSILRDSE